MHTTFGSKHHMKQYGNQGLLAVDPKAMAMPYGSISQMKDQYDHMGSYRGQYARADPRFSKVNRTVGEFISL